MKKASRYTKAPRNIARELETSVPIEDFLPSPREIASIIRKPVLRDPDDEMAVAEKLSALRTQEYFRGRAKRGNIKSALKLLERLGVEAPCREGDELY